MNELHAALSPAAERMRLHRERKRNQMRYIGIELHETEIEALIRRGLLAYETRNDANAIITALYHFLEDTLGRTP